MNDKVFPDGIFIKKPNENAPDFVGPMISIKKSELIPWLNKQEGDWVNIKSLTSKKGNLYLELDTWKPKVQEQATQERDNFDKTGEDLPF